MGQEAEKGRQEVGAKKFFGGELLSHFPRGYNLHPFQNGGRPVCNPNPNQVTQVPGSKKLRSIFKGGCVFLGWALK